MALYSFTDTTPGSASVSDPLQTIWGGSVLDETVPGLRTLTVTGREMLSPILQSTNRVGGDGAWVDGVTLPARLIYVEVLVDDYQAQSPTLMELLYTGKQTLAFADEPGWHYEAYFSGVEARRNDITQQIVTLVFLCACPYALSELRTSTGAIESATGLPVLLESVTATLTGAAGTGLRLTAGARHIVIDGAGAAGDVFVVRWSGSPLVSVNGQPATNRLSLISDWETFAAGDGDSVTAMPAATLSVLYRERRL